jgi:hypothetical protein
MFRPNQLGSLASVIRAKNSGPFEVTFDIIFDSKAKFDMVKSSGILTRSTVAALYNLDESEIVTAMWWEQALAFKATVTRTSVSGGWGEVDMHSSTQHVKLMDLEVPVGLSSWVPSLTASRSTQQVSSKVQMSTVIPMLIAVTGVIYAMRLRGRTVALKR